LHLLRGFPTGNYSHHQNFQRTPGYTGTPPWHTRHHQEVHPEIHQEDHQEDQEDQEDIVRRLSPGGTAFQRSKLCHRRSRQRPRSPQWQATAAGGGGGVEKRRWKPATPRQQTVPKLQKLDKAHTWSSRKKDNGILFGDLQLGTRKHNKVLSVLTLIFVPRGYDELDLSHTGSHSCTRFIDVLRTTYGKSLIREYEYSFDAQSVWMRLLSTIRHRQEQ
jgi:hypothetical protein